MNEGWCLHIDDLGQERRNSSALAMELRLSCTNPSIWSTVILCGFRREKQEQLQTICSGTSVMLAYEVQCSWVDSQGRGGEGGGVVNNSNNRSEVDERLCLQTKSRDLVWIPNGGGRTTATLLKWMKDYAYMRTLVPEAGISGRDKVYIFSKKEYNIFALRHRISWCPDYLEYSHRKQIPHISLWMRSFTVQFKAAVFIQ